MPARVTSDDFIGRHAELAELDHALAEARRGRAMLAFVSGESGVGKSRLVDHFTDRSKAGGARILWGDCVELGSELPYAPIVGALRPLARRGDPALDELGQSRAELARLLPELGAAGDLRVEPVAGTGQARLFELLLWLVERLARDAPLVFVLDDIHWADASTRDFLAFLARNLCGERVLVVATYRSDELHRRHPLRPLLAELERTERAHRVELHRFTREELGEQLAAILEEQPDPDLLARLWQRTEGNALFAEELLAAERDGHGALPASLRDALMVRVEALAPDTQEALRWVAAAARIEHDLLEEISGLDPRTLRDALREAVAHHVLVGYDDASYGFRHALLREVVYDDLLPGELVELHRVLATAMEARIDGAACVRLERAAEIAHHYDAAGDQPAALRAALRAAEAAERVYAENEEAAHLSRALELWERVDDPEALTGIDHVELLHRTAAAHTMDPGRGVTLVKAALEELDRDAEPYRAAALLERLGKSQWSLGKGRAAMESWDKALALLPADPPSEERARLLAAKANGFMLWGHGEEADRLADVALEAADAAGSAWARAHALNTKGVAKLNLGDPGGAQELIGRSMAMAREMDSVFLTVRAYINLSDVLHLIGRTRDAHDLLRSGADELQRDGVDATWLRLQRAEMAYHLGLWDESAALLPPELAPRKRGITLVFYELRRAELELARGENDSARARLERARELIARTVEPQWHGPIVALLAALERRERRIDAARAVIAQGLERLEGEDDTHAGQGFARIFAAAAGVESDAAQNARAVGDAQAADTAAAAARDYARRARAASELPSARAIPEARACALVAEAEAAAAAGDDDPARWAAAADAYDAIDRPYRVARNRRRQAEALLAAGDRAGAEQAAGEAVAIARRIGAAWLEAELDALARRGRLRLEPLRRVTDADVPPEDEDAAAALGLTPREREVLVLVAQGRTNREIGELLYMAEKTASVHVSRILGKLEVRSRTEAAAVAHRLGLEVGGGPVAAAG